MVTAYAIHRHYDSPEASAMACRAVRNLSCIDDIAAKFVQEGTIEGLIELLKLAVADELYSAETTEVSALPVLLAYTTLYSHSPS
jgi:hypothetical protein